MLHSSRSRWFVVGALLAVLVAAAAVGCGSSSSGSDELELKGDGSTGVDDSNSRFVKGPINSGNAASLEQAWTMPLTAQSSFGAYASIPVIAGEVVYMQDLQSNVHAVALEDGEKQWTKRYGESTLGPNGVVVADGRVFGATASRAFALDQETGKELWATPLLENEGESIDMAPGYHDGLVYVSTVPTNASAAYPGGGVGTLWALDAKTGGKEWSFATVPKGLWGNKRVNSGGGLWYPPSFDEQGSMYFGTGNPAPFAGAPGEPWGSSRPGPNLYTNSMIKMDAKTGKMDWYYQQTPHDVYDWDFQNSPILTEAGGRQLAIGSGKSGIVVAVDRRTGKPVWERPVGRHSGNEDDGLHAMRGELDKLNPGEEVSPGTLGGVIAPIAANATTLFVPVVNHPIKVPDGITIQEQPAMTGELVAVDIESGAIEWSQKFPTAAFGAPTVVNDVVFLATFDGVVRGLDVDSGGEVWQASLPAASNSGLMASGDTLVVPAGLPTAEGQKAEVVAFKVGG